MNVGMCECGIMGMWEYGNRVMLLNVACCMLYVWMAIYISVRSIVIVFHI